MSGVCEPQLLLKYDVKLRESGGSTNPMEDAALVGSEGGWIGGRDRGLRREHGGSANEGDVGGRALQTRIIRK